MSQPEGIAIIGKMSSGKTTLGYGLLTYFNYVPISLASPLKDLARQAYGTFFDKSHRYYVWPLGSEDGEVITGRQVLQQLGQSVKVMDRLFWTNILMNDIQSGINYSCDDVRFPYEADSLRKRDWATVRVNTPEPVRYQRYQKDYGRYPTLEELSHPSETSMDDYEVDLEVDGTLTVEENMARIGAYFGLRAV